VIITIISSGVFVYHSNGTGTRYLRNHNVREMCGILGHPAVPLLLFLMYQRSLHIDIFRNRDVLSSELTKTSCLTNLYYYSHVNPNLQLTVPMTSWSHSVGCALEPTVLHPSTPDCLLICDRLFSRLRIQPSVIPAWCRVL
jgi:hypothetical protein